MTTELSANTQQVNNSYDFIPISLRLMHDVAYETDDY